MVAGDLVDPPSLARACAGATRVVASAHGMIGRGRYRSEAVDDEGHRALVAAAQAAVDFFRTKHAIEHHLRASGLPFTIIRAAAFMEWHAHEFNGRHILAGRTATLPGRGTKRRNFVAAADVARMVMRALDDPALQGKTIEIGGPGNYTDDVMRMAALDDDAWDATFDAGPVAAGYNLDLTSLDQFIADRVERSRT